MCILWFLDGVHCLLSAKYSFQQVLQSFGVTDLADELGLFLKDFIFYAAEEYTFCVFQALFT